MLCLWMSQFYLIPLDNSTLQVFVLSAEAWDWTLNSLGQVTFLDQSGKVISENLVYTRILYFEWSVCLIMLTFFFIHWMKNFFFLPVWYRLWKGPTKDIHFLNRSLNLALSWDFPMDWLVSIMEKVYAGSIPFGINFTFKINGISGLTHMPTKYKIYSNLNYIYTHKEQRTTANY